MDNTEVTSLMTSVKKRSKELELAAVKVESECKKQYAINI
jgi:hypothetical protein